jgi:hypothetical protein
MVQISPSSSLPVRRGGVVLKKYGRIFDEIQYIPYLQYQGFSRRL